MSTPAQVPQDDGILNEIKNQVSPEEQTEILEKINQAVQESKISYSPDVWTATKASSGLSLTLSLNALVVAVIIGGLWSVITFFQTSRTALVEDYQQLQTAEARILEEIKRESDLALGQKDREIAEIQARLANIDKEKRTLVSETEARILAKERELEQRLQIEIQRERERLITQGLGQEEIERRIRELTERRRREIDAELQAFKVQTENERRRLERALNEAQENYRATLNAAAVERQKILEETQRREQEIQSRTQVISTELQQAQSQIAALRARSEQLATLDNQVAGLIARAREQFTKGEWRELKDTSEAINQVIRLPAYEQDAQALSRRQGHSLLAQALTNIAETRLAQEQAAQSQDGAGASIAQALALQEAWVEAEALLRDAENDWRRENYDAALQKSLRAQNLVKLNPGGAEFFRRWFDLGTQRALEDKAKSDTQEAQNLLRQAQSLRNNDPQRARAALSSLLAQYPLAEQRKEALDQLQQLSSTSEIDLKRRISELEAQLGQAPSQQQNTAAANTVEIDRMRQENTQLQNQIQTLNQRIRDTEQQLAVAREQLRTQQQTSTPAQNEPAQSRAQTAQLETQLAQTKADLVKALEDLRKEKLERQQDAPLALKYLSLQDGYKSYSQSLSALGANQELERQQLLNTFLVQLSQNDVFPQFKSRVDAALAAARNAGQKESLYYASDILEGTRVLTNDSGRQAYFGSLRQRYRNDPGMLDFLRTLEDYVRGN